MTRRSKPVPIPPEILPNFVFTPLEQTNHAIDQVRKAKDLRPEDIPPGEWAKASIITVMTTTKQIVDFLGPKDTPRGTPHLKAIYRITKELRKRLSDDPTLWADAIESQDDPRITYAFKHILAWRRATHHLLHRATTGTQRRQYVEDFMGAS